MCFTYRDEFNVFMGILGYWHLYSQVKQPLPCETRTEGNEGMKGMIFRT